MTRKLTIEQANRLRNDFECWQQDYDPKDDKEQYDMFGRGMAAMDMLIAGMYQEPVAWRWRRGPDTRWHLASSGDLAGEVEPLYRHAQQPVVPEALQSLRTIVANPRRLPRRKEWIGGQQYSYVLLEEVEALIEDAYRAAMLQAGNSPVIPDGSAVAALTGIPMIPDGYVMVPKEPTERMVIDGFESEPDETFSEPEVWEKYQKMSGCQQAAYRARLCYAAMISAAPKQENI